MLPSHLVDLPRGIFALLADTPHDDIVDLAPLHIGYGAHGPDDPPYSWDNSNRGLHDGKPYCLLQYTLTGAGAFRDESGVRHTVSEGQAFICPQPSRTAYWLEPGGSWEWLWVNFGGKAALTLVEKLIARQGCVLSIGHGSAPVRLLADLYRQADEVQLMSVYHASAGMYRFLMELAHLFLSPRLEHPVAITRALRLIQERLSDPSLCLDDLAREARLSRYYFTRLFTSIVGQSPGRHIETLRMHRAIELLYSTPLLVKEVAAQVGYRHTSHFVQVFRRHHGITPSAVNTNRISPDR